MSRKNSPTAKATRRAEREAKGRVEAVARHTVCKLCSRRRLTTPEGVCGICLSEMMSKAAPALQEAPEGPTAVVEANDEGGQSVTIGVAPIGTAAKAESPGS